MFALPAGHPTQLYMIFRAEDVQQLPNLIHLLVWPEGDTWKIADARIIQEKIGRWDYDSALAAAREQNKAGHAFEALAMYRVAYALSQRVPYRTTGRFHALDAETTPLAKSLGLPNNPDDTLKVDHQSINIFSSYPLQFGKALYLTITIPETELTDNDTMNQRHMAIAKALLARHPQLQQEFEGIGVMSVDQKTGKAYRSSHAMKELIDPSQSTDSATENAK